MVVSVSSAKPGELAEELAEELAPVDALPGVCASAWRKSHLEPYAHWPVFHHLLHCCVLNCTACVAVSAIDRSTQAVAGVEPSRGSTLDCTETECCLPDGCRAQAK